jgi:hypothetical protein
VGGVAFLFCLLILLFAWRRRFNNHKRERARKRELQEPRPFPSHAADNLTSSSALPAMTSKGRLLLREQPLPTPLSSSSIATTSQILSGPREESIPVSDRATSDPGLSYYEPPNPAAPNEPLAADVLRPASERAGVTAEELGIPAVSPPGPTPHNDLPAAMHDINGTQLDNIMGYLSRIGAIQRLPPAEDEAPPSYHR